MTRNSIEERSVVTESKTDSAGSNFDFKAFLTIIRPQNCFIGGLTVIAGISMGFKLLPLTTSLWDFLDLFVYSYITYFAVAAGGNVVNDIFDIEIDRINRPHRALPSGRMSIKQAWYYVAFWIVVGIFFSWLGVATNLMQGRYVSLSVVIVFVVVAYAYAAKVKSLGLAGNIMVAFSFAFGVIYGALVYGEVAGGIAGAIAIPLPAWLFFLTAFMVLQARETIKGAEDVEGDAIRDVRTIARVYGHEAAAFVAAFLNTIGVICFASVWLLGFANWALWPLLLAGCIVVIGAAISPLTGPRNEKRLLIGSTLDKIGALIGLIAFVVIPLFDIILGI
ncbi:MAG: hypothetical protein EAX95_07890 [Candidatus Thorarchaeota archaeon]|nr:hypothetical protein [Candidatus Thorarchaeota archaeon]